MTLIILLLITMSIMALPIVIQVLYILLRVVLWGGSWLIALYVIYCVITKIFNL